MPLGNQHFRSQRNRGGDQIEISFDTMKQIGHEMQDAPDVVRQNEVEERILDFRMGPGGF